MLKSLVTGIVSSCILLLVDFGSISASQLAEVALRERDDLSILLLGGFDIAGVSPGSMVDVILHNKDERDKLNETGLRYFITQEDLESYFRSRLEPNRDDMGGYMTLSEIEDRMNELHEDFPDIIGEPISIGQTIEDREIYAIKVSDNPDDEEDEPEVLYVAAIHPREVITPLILFAYIELLAENYEEDEFLASLVDERQMWFILCHNPDGYAYNEETDPDGGGMWRKNRRDNGGGYYGVDLNRNYGYEWGYDNEGSSPNRSDPLYRGTEAFSEPETQAVRDFVNDHLFTISLFFHAWGNIHLYPFGYDYLQPDDRSVLSALGRHMAVDNHYDAGTGWELIYPTNGDSDDWLYASDEHDQIMAFTTEVGTRQDYFWPPLNRVEPLIEENLSTCIATARFADNPLRALRPLTPVDVDVSLDDRGSPLVTWFPIEDEDNPAVGYNVRAVMMDEPIFDGEPEDQSLWELAHVSVSGTDQHAGDNSYRVSTSADMALMTLREAIPAPDTMWAWINYDLRDFLDHYLALEISYDGYDWEPLSGLHTSNLVINDQNLGPGITGTSNDWVRTWWTTDEHHGEVVQFRFRYYQFGRRQQNEMCFIDEIGPLPTYDLEIPFVEVIEDTFFVDDDREIYELLLYQVRAIDAEGDLSNWSVPLPVRLPPSSYTLTMYEGWNMVGMPLMPEDPGLPQLFEDLINLDILTVVKNGAGEVFAPRNDLNEIAGWDPLSGYQIKVDEDINLEAVGRLVPPDTLIPLTEGWNLVNYLPENPQPVAEALASIEENVKLVKDGRGEFWAIEYDFDILGDMEPGRGYSMRLEAADTLVYNNPVLTPRRRHRNEYVATGKTLMAFANNHSLLLRFENSLPAGDLRLLDAEGLPAGQIRITEPTYTVGLAAWGEENLKTAGYRSGESFRAEFQADDNGMVSRVDLILKEGGSRYEVNGFTVFNAELEQDRPSPEGFEIFQAYPNPFNGTATIRFRTDSDALTKLDIIDLTGRKIKNLLSSDLKAGVHQVHLDASDMPSGIYLARLNLVTGDKGLSREIKLVLMR